MTPIKITAKKTWKLLSQILNRNVRKKTITKPIDPYATELSEPFAVAYAFNEYFSNAPIKIASQLDSPNRDFSSYLSSNYSESIYVCPIMPENIMKILNSLNNTSGGHVSIPINVVKNIIYIISAPLAEIFNNCIDIFLVH